MTKPYLPRVPGSRNLNGEEPAAAFNITYLTTGQAAKLLGVTTRCIQLAVDKGVLTDVRTPKGHRRLITSEVQQLRDRMMQAAAAPALASEEGVAQRFIEHAASVQEHTNEPPPTFQMLAGNAVFNTHFNQHRFLAFREGLLAGLGITLHDAQIAHEYLVNTRLRGKLERAAKQVV